MTGPQTSPSVGSPGDPPPYPANWFPDPLGRYEYRWFNGRDWTSDVSTDGRRYVDPFGAAPHPHGGQAPYSGDDGSYGNGSATVALACGLIGALFAWMPLLVAVGVVLGVLAIVFGVKGVQRARHSGTGRGMAITGIVTGVVTLALSVVGVVMTVITWKAVVDFAEPGPAYVVVDECQIDDRTALVTGELTNESADRRAYAIFVTVGNRREIVAVDAVAPGDTVQWTAQLTDGVIAATCEPELVLTGPLPFGIEVDPIDP